MLMSSFTVSSPTTSTNVPVPYTSGSVSSTSGLSTGVSAKDYAMAAGKILISRYGPPLARAAITRLDATMNSVNEAVAGKGSSNGSSGGSKSPSSGKSNGNGGGNNSNNSGGGGNSRGGYRSRSNPNSNSNGTGVGGSADIKGVPQLTLDSGIDSGTVINPWQDTTDFYTPLFVQCGQLFPDLNSQVDCFYARLMNKEVHFRYSVLVQSQVNFSMAKLFTEENFYEFIIRTAQALQLYYMVDSILAYTSHTPNQNIALSRLRYAMTPDILNGHIKLRKVLEEIPIPPNMCAFIRHMYQNYSFSDVVGSPVIRLSYKESLCTSESKGPLCIDAGTYSQVIDDLISCGTTISIIKKIRENWVKPMEASSFEALYDPQFSTFWHNSIVAYEDFGSKAVKYTINTKDDYSPMYYGIFGNRLDGLIYSSCSVVNDKGIIQMGLWCPFNDFSSKQSINSSLLHAANDGLVRPVTDIQFRNSSMIYAAPNTRITQDKNLIWEVTRNSYSGACIPQYHSIANVTQAITRSIDWLLNP